MDYSTFTLEYEVYSNASLERLSLNLNDVKPYEGRRTLANGESSSDPEPEPMLPEEISADEEDESAKESDSSEKETPEQTTRRGRKVRLPSRYR